MSCESIISVNGVSKAYRIWNEPSDRLKSPAIDLLSRLIPKKGGIPDTLRRKARSYYNEFYALDNVSLEVGRGESVGIVGRNGSGKSTLLQIIAGTLHPTSGTVTTRGRIAALLELGSGFNPEFTGRENVYLNASLIGLSREEVDERFDAIAAFADIGEFINQPVKTYSSGMYVRLAFAVIVNVDADILIVDEALAVGDVFFVQKCMRFLRGFQERGALLFVSHDLATVNNLCDRAVWMEKGRVRTQGEPKAVTELYFSRHYLGAENEVETPREVSVEHTIERKPCESEDHVDPRLPWINASPYRNDLKLFAFDPMGDSFGILKGRVVDARFTDVEGNPLSYIVGCERVAINVTVEAEERLESIIIGFGVKDSLGQVLFGDNTYLTFCEAQPCLEAGERATATFVFQMPRLRPGNYTVSTTLATGSQDDHQMQHWLHDGLVFQSIVDSQTSGLIGIPMQRIEIRREGVLISPTIKA
ncbi:MAG: ABC transporter ATP-binding protein [Puniceicoccaceae bacterium]